MNTLTQLQTEAREKIESLGDYHEVNGEDVYDPPTDKEILKVILPLISIAFQAGKDASVEYVEANALWIKEDVHDGNDGNFHVSKILLNQARSV